MVGDGVEEDREQRRERALASVREGRRWAEAAGYSNVSNDEINAEIDRIRRMPEGERKCV
jgi:hypothetical protein